MAERILTDVLPSGVEFSVRSLKGRDQELITKAKNVRDGSGFNEMLASCLTQLGDKKQGEITPNDVERMLSNDRKYAMVALRQHSLRHKPTFDFSYEWPLQGTRKDVQQYSVEFNSTDFPCVPYLWVREKIEQLKAEAAANKVEYTETKFPKLYESYSEMLAAHKEQTFVLPEDGTRLGWTLLTGEQESKFSKLDREQVNANTMISMRVPQVLLTPKEGVSEAKQIGMGWMHSNADLLDIEAFRGEVRKVEGTINTTLVIQNQKDSTRTARVELLATPDFFFPSQAI